MRSARWHANGNVYLVTEDSLTPGLVRERVGDADGFVEVLASGQDALDILIWNPDGSRAEMSGNGTRIAARWLASRTGAREVVVRVADNEVHARMLDGPYVEQRLAPVVVGPPEEVAGFTVVPVVVGNPHAVVEEDPARLLEIGPVLETHPRFPQRTNVQVARRSGDGTIEARVWERGVGETGSSGSSAVAVAAAFGMSPVTINFPGGPLDVRLDGDTAYLTGPAEPLDLEVA